MGRYEADHILFGAAYYDEYLMMKGIDRIDEDMAMMKAAGLNVIRIAESTWSTCEPQPGVFDFTYVDRALDAANRAGIDVIVGTPTYAVPSWLVKLDPSVLAVTPSGQGKYGARQIMDIVNATYRFYGERVIRKLISHVADHPAVIGYQVDNETKYYDSVSDDMQRLFVKYLREKFHGDLDEHQPPLRPRLLVEPHRLLGGLPGRDRHHQRVPGRRIRQVPPRPGARLPAVAGRHRARIRA